MKHETIRRDPIRSGKRRPVNLSIDTGIAAHAREHGISMSQVVETALREATREAEARRWKEENAGWIKAHNRWIEENGIPLAGLAPL